MGAGAGLWLLFAAVLGSSLVSLGTVCQWLGSLHAYGAHTHGQVALAVSLCCLSALWLAAELCALARRVFGGRDLAYQGVESGAGVEPVPEVLGRGGAEAPRGSPKGAAPEGEDAPAAQGGGAPPAKKVASWSPLPLCCEAILEEGEQATREGPLKSPLAGQLEPLRACGELAMILAGVYLCDRTNVLGRRQKVQSRAAFWGLWALIMVAALLSTRRLEKAKPLQREQTDEWKGWMQLMFVMYHYFKEEDIYNAIRVYIACYVFMTGYGNLFLYLKGKSFTLRRNLQMMFRLNFLGFVVCVTLNNEYIDLSDYICAMHTLFTVFVILALYIRHSLNGSRAWVHAKIVLTFLGVVVIYDGPPFIFKAVFGTLPVVRPLFAFHDPVHPEFTDEMHEFHFRSGLDRFIWVLGMLYALHFPDFEAYLEALEQKKPLHRAAWNAALLAACFLAMGAWFLLVFSKGKYEYNAIHPYTSWIPITAYMLVRNISAPLRSRYMRLFAYLGKYPAACDLHTAVPRVDEDHRDQRLAEESVGPDPWPLLAQLHRLVGGLPLCIGAPQHSYHHPPRRRDTRGQR
ncbi:unnamed protein product [Prorocentrum cordatum]|uniref:Cas1p 10 TM acyl transferase domain-containing protein n=1 Tax=Prorocentrum cordatum TaxID=2364126 RepID=A0ABN9X6N7_9DINO|nr:unnamed protein product [Polarella glacialis]